MTWPVMSSVLLAAGDATVRHEHTPSGIVSALAVAMICTGLVFFLGAVVGMVRFPDFYTRMHAAGKGDTLSSLLVILGFALYHLDAGGWDTAHWLVALKLLGICAFIMITSPTSTHALINAGYEDGCVPETGEGGNALAGIAPQMPAAKAETGSTEEGADSKSDTAS
jgi:multicomponent Na+:H+ antiporter subunit G